MKSHTESRFNKTSNNKYDAFGCKIYATAKKLKLRKKVKHHIKSLIPWTGNDMHNSFCEYKIKCQEKAIEKHHRKETRRKSLRNNYHKYFCYPVQICNEYTNYNSSISLFYGSNCYQMSNNRKIRKTDMSPHHYNLLKFSEKDIPQICSKDVQIQNNNTGKTFHNLTSEKGTITYVSNAEITDNEYVNKFLTGTTSHLNCSDNQDVQKQLTRNQNFYKIKNCNCHKFCTPTHLKNKTKLKKHKHVVRNSVRTIKSSQELKIYPDDVFRKSCRTFTRERLTSGYSCKNIQSDINMCYRENICSKNIIYQNKNSNLHGDVCKNSCCMIRKQCGDGHKIKMQSAKIPNCAINKKRYNYTCSKPTCNVYDEDMHISKCNSQNKYDTCSSPCVKIRKCDKLFSCENQKFRKQLYKNMNSKCDAKKVKKYVSRPSCKPVSCCYKARCKCNQKEEKVIEYKHHRYFMLSLRKKPFICIYKYCPWIYPQCVNVIRFCENSVHAFLFFLAFLIWSPCILAILLCTFMFC
ncbi:uncharacterized protein LOC131847024 [Achroia grisella]|uniref:uncharacterized protein LOC131847024 n=1 Tax=Achroia grisella TaxID=688607 RepID=UPI0027D22FBF|nr:uncharacterized protein LOC131847024 [Achroia grisella]XP_059052448.1 uncharacterized protein LOC131847024 [Achroia grisella]